MQSLLPLDSDTLEASIVMPCLNEAETLRTCVEKALKFLCLHGIRGEVVVADNGSTDGSKEIAQACGARVVEVPTRGYGAALMGAIEAAKGKYIIMGDSDDSYNFTDLMPFIEKLRDGYDLVMGNRFRGGIKPGAMPALHRYLGNPVLSFIGRLFFKSPIKDFQCGLRAFDRNKFLSLDLRTSGMEWASEMVVKATLNHYRITEVPVVLSPDGRSRRPHLRSWRDGWRNLRFLLMYSPHWLFLYPGLCLAGLGFAAMLRLAAGPVSIAQTTFDIHTLLLSGAAVIIGIQAVVFAILAKRYGVTHKLLPNDPQFSSIFDHLSLEGLLTIGALLVLSGLGGIILAVMI